MTTVDENDCDVSDDDMNDKENTPLKLKRKSSIIPFQFVDIEAVESDGDGGDVNNAEDHDGFMSDQQGMVFVFLISSFYFLFA